MLRIVVPEREFYDERIGEFVTTKQQTLNLEHSLISISKWEAKWKKAFLGKKERTYEESIDYVRCMTLNTVSDPKVYYGLTRENFDDISKYIEDPMTATWFNERASRGTNGKTQTVTSELIYYWMVAYNIPFECEKWHLNRLLALIRICDIKNAPDKKANKKDILSRNRALNAARRRSLGTSG